MRKMLTIMFVSLAVLYQVQAQDSVKTTLLNEVVVSGTKFQLPEGQSGKVIFKLKDSDLQQQGRTVADVLNDVPSIQVDGVFNSPGTNLSYYVRGARNRQTLLVLDGVPLNDPTGIDLFFDLRFLALGQVDNLEVLQGGLSSLYGSGAAAAVVNIQTKTPSSAGVHGQVGATLSSWKSIGQNIQVGGVFNKISFQLLANNFSSDGFSAALDKTGNQNYDKDGYNRKNAFLNAGYAINENLKATIFAGYDAFDADFDAGAFIDNNNRQKQEQIRKGIKLDFTYVRGELKFLTQHTKIQRDFFGSFPTEYEGSTFFAELTHKHRITEKITLLSGTTLQKLRYDSLSFTVFDPYTSAFVQLPKGINIQAGVRLNTHSEYGTKFVYNINPSWTRAWGNQIKTKVQTSLSSSFITPSLYQLHSPWGGNLELKPEETINYEYGVSFYALNKLSIMAINFYRDEKNTIGYIQQYENLTDQRYVRGWTFTAEYKFSDKVTLRADHSYTYTNKPATFYRIPKSKTGLGIEVMPHKSSKITMRYAVTGTRTDLYYDENFNVNEVSLSSYQLVDLSASQQFFKDKFSICLSVYNLLNEDFVGVYGFTTRGRNYSASINYRF